MGAGRLSTRSSGTITCLPFDGSAPNRMPARTLLIRADASSDIGVGHVMRCAALAQVWRSAGGRAIFALATGSEELQDRVRSWGSDVAKVRAHPGSEEDAVQTEELCATCAAEWLVLDGYHFSASYRDRVNGDETGLLLIDDHGECPPYRCDFVLNANPQACDALYKLRGGRTRFLLGPRYALLRQEFLKFQRSLIDVPDIAQRVLITFGGSDSHNVTLKVLQALREITELPLEITVVMGALNPHIESIQAAAAASPHATRVLSNAENMPELVSRSDLAITAGGGTCYELAFMQVPMFLTITAKNHELTVQTWGGAKAAIAGGWFYTLTPESLVAALRALISDSKLRRELRENASRMVDGKGPQRVVEIIRSANRKG